MDDGPESAGGGKTRREPEELKLRVGELSLYPFRYFCGKHPVALTFKQVRDGRERGQKGFGVYVRDTRGFSNDRHKKGHDKLPLVCFK